MFHLHSDEFCPHCDNHFVLEAVTPTPSLQVEGDDARINNKYGQETTNEPSVSTRQVLTLFPRMLKDDRIRGEQERSIFNLRDVSDRMG